MTPLARLINSYFSNTGSQSLPFIQSNFSKLELKPLAMLYQMIELKKYLIDHYNIDPEIFKHAAENPDLKTQTVSLVEKNKHIDIFAIIASDILLKVTSSNSILIEDKYSHLYNYLEKIEEIRLKINVAPDGDSEISLEHLKEAIGIAKVVSYSLIHSINILNSKESSQVIIDDDILDMFNDSDIPAFNIPIPMSINKMILISDTDITTVCLTNPVDGIPQLSISNMKPNKHGQMNLTKKCFRIDLTDDYLIPHDAVKNIEDKFQSLLSVIINTYSYMLARPDNVIDVEPIKQTGKIGKKKKALFDFNATHNHVSYIKISGDTRKIYNKCGSSERGIIDKRFVVRGHWREQPFGKQNTDKNGKKTWGDQRRPVFIPPYMKGSHEMELMEHVYEL